MNLREQLLKQWKNISGNRYFRAVEDILLFLVITLAVHFGWRYWAYGLHYAPVAREIIAASQFTVHQLVIQTSWILDHLFGVGLTRDGNILWFDNSYGLSINDSYSGFKQIAQFVLLMLLFPGPWKHKAWFIPAGMIILYLTNLFRLLMLGLTLNYIPQHHHLIHGYLLRALFYVVIFLLWVYWVSRFRKKPQKPIRTQPTSE